MSTKIIERIEQQKTDIARLAEGAGIALAGRILGRTMNAATQVTLARLLGPELFGLYVLAFTLVMVTSFVSQLGLDKGVVRYGLAYWDVDHTALKGVLYQSLACAIFFGIVIGGGLYLLAPWLAAQVFRKPDLTWVIRWFAPAVALASGLRVAVAATRVSHRIQYGVYVEDVTQPTLNLCLIIISFVMGWGLFGVVGAGVISFAVALFLALYYVQRLFPKASSSQVSSLFITRELLTFSLPVMAAGIFTQLLMWTDRLLVGGFCSAADVGIYQAASQIAVLLAIIVNTFNIVISPMIADLYHKKQLQRIDELFKVSTKWGLYLSLPLFLVLVLAPREIIGLMFGRQYEDGAFPLVVLTIAQFINVGTGAVDQLLIMTGQQKYWLCISSAMLFVNVVLSWLLIPRLGLLGVALGSAGASVGLFVGALFQVRRTLGLWPYDRRYLKGGMATALAASALLLLRFAGVGTQMLDLALLLAVSLGIFVTTLAALGLDREDRTFIAMVQTR